MRWKQWISGELIFNKNHCPAAYGNPKCVALLSSSQCTDVTKLVTRLRHHNLNLSEQECADILQSHFSDVNLANISEFQIDQLYTIFNNRIALNIEFEKYAIPVLNYIGPQELRTYFLTEQKKGKSLNECKSLIYKLEGNREKLTLDGFYRLMEMDAFDVINPVHRKCCQNMNMPITHYYVASVMHIRYPDKAEQKRLISTIASDALNITGQDKEQIILAKYRELLWNNFRCFQVNIEWNDKLGRFRIPIKSINQNEVYYLHFECFLKEMKVSAFKNSKYPVILQLKCQDEINDNTFYFLKYLIEDILKDSLHKTGKCVQMVRKKSKTVTLKSLRYKFLVFFESQSNSLHDRIRMSSLITNEQDIFSCLTFSMSSSIKKIFMDIYNNRNKLKYFASTLFEHDTSLELINRFANKMQEEWPSITKKLFTMAIDDRDTGINSEHETNISAIELLRVGVQSIPIDLDQDFNLDSKCILALFQLNGNCGYVLKPVSLRNGKLYCVDGLSEDKPLENEPKSGPCTISIRIICGLNLMIYKQNMNTQVKIQVLSHPSDYFEYTTRVCSCDGQIPFWNEQIKFRLGMINLAFLYIEVKNEGQLIGYNIIPMKAMLSGDRFIRLYDQENQEINEAKLYIHTNIRTIASCWSPYFPDDDANSEDGSQSSNNADNQSNNSKVIIRL